MHRPTQHVQVQVQVGSLLVQTYWFKRRLVVPVGGPFIARMPDACSRCQDHFNDADQLNIPELRHAQNVNLRVKFTP